MREVLRLRRPRVWGVPTARPLAALRIDLAALAVVVAGAAFLRLWDLGAQSFWVDEAGTAQLAARPLGPAWHQLNVTELTPPLYYAMLWVWHHVAGGGEAMLRLPSALAGVLTVPVAWAAVREVAGSRAAIFTAALVATNPMLLWFSQEARSYSLMVLLTSVALLFCLRALRTGARRDIVLWAVAAAIAPVCHYFAAFVVAPQAALLLVRLRDRRRDVLLASGGVALVGAALAPLALHQLQLGPGGSSANWIDAIPLWSRVREVGHELLYANTDLISSNSAPPHSSLRWLAVAALAIALAGLLSGRVVRRAAIPLAAVAVGGLLIPLVFSVTPADTFKDRNLMAVWVPILGIAGTGLAAPRLGRVGAVGAAALAISGVAVQYDVLTDASLQRLQWRDLGSALDRPAAPRAMFIVPWFNRQVLRYYGHPTQLWKAGTRVRELMIVGNLGPLGYHPPPAPPGFGRPEAHQVLSLWYVRYRSRRPVTVRPGEFGLPVTRLYLEG